MNELEKHEIDFDPFVLELNRAVKFGKDYIERLVLREPTAKEIRSLKVNGDMSMGDLLDIGQKLAETNRRVIDSLSGKDAMALVERVGFLLESGL